MQWMNFDKRLLDAGFSGVDFCVFIIIFLLFVFSRQLVDALPAKEWAPDKRLFALRLINIILLLLYLTGLYLVHIAKPITQTALTLLLILLVVRFIQMRILRRFGREQHIEEAKYHVHTYLSAVFGLLVTLIAVITVVLTALYIWNLTGWPQVASVLGGLLLVVFPTMYVWAPENINGLILLYNGNVEPGSVVRVNELDLLGMVIQTTLTQTVLRDLITHHLIVLPNRRFRACKIEVLSDSRPGGLEQYVDFKIGYDVPSVTVEVYLTEVWHAALSEKAINPEKSPRVRLVETGDHAVLWRLYFTVSTVYRLLEARFAVHRAAFDLSCQFDIRLQTPLTHQVEQIPGEYDESTAPE